jgi:hypothetical protein
MSSPAQIEKSKCGDITEFEKKLKRTDDNLKACARPAKSWQPVPQ